jgi:hypothetical protein
MIEASKSNNAKDKQSRTMRGMSLPLKEHLELEIKTLENASRDFAHKAIAVDYKAKAV